MSAMYTHAARCEFFDKNPIAYVRQTAKRQHIPEVLAVEGRCTPPAEETNAEDFLAESPYGALSRYSEDRNANCLNPDPTGLAAGLRGVQSKLSQAN